MLRDRRLWTMAALGFMAGLPLPLSGFTFRLWLSEGGVSLAMIGLTANIGLAYSLKFLWAPVLDQARPPGPLRWLGQRRGWLMTIQPLLALSALMLALSDPSAAPAAAIAAAALVAFLSASQDIAVDAWRIEVFPPKLQGAAMAVYVWGYRAALLISGAGAIKAADLVGWHTALLGVALLLALAPLVTLLAREPDVARDTQIETRPERLLSYDGPHREARRTPVETRPDRLLSYDGAHYVVRDTPFETRLARFVARIRHAVVDPLREFLTRPGAITILAFVALFKLDEAMAGVMAAPFYRSLGFDKNAIAVANFLPALAAVLSGIAVGGFLVARLGVGRALLLTGCVQSAAVSMYVVLAFSHGQVHVLYFTVFLEAFVGGLADAAFIAYLSGLCSVAFTATQYALLSSVAAIALRTVGGLTGFLAEAVGWPMYYSICVLATLPSIFLMLRVLRRYPPVERVADG